MPDFVSAVGWSSHILSILWTGPGLVLVGSINGGQASNLCTLIAGGDVALSVTGHRHRLEWVNGLLQRYKFDSPVRVGTCVVSVMALCIHQEEERFLPFSVINIMTLSRGSIILISLGLRGGSYFNSE